jgi:uncharacterized repeat protein (TIGR03847 family)
MDASRAKYQLGSLSSVSAEAIGEPGHRTFRLSLQSGAASASLWLEKEQLYQLAIYIREIIASSPGSPPKEAEPADPPWSGGITSVDFKVGRMALGYDSSSNSFLFLAHDIEEPEENTATVSFRVTLGQGEALAREALEVCAAGRPLCHLCAQPIDPQGHVCPRANGHTPLQA